MKKTIKGILISIIVLIIIYIILVLTKVLPNPFLDTKDLVCIRENKLPGYVEIETVILEFNKDTTVKNYREIYQMKYENIEEYEEYKKYLESIDKEHEYNDEEKIIYIEELIRIKKENNYYKKTKQEMKEIMLKDIHYSKCE